MMTMPAPSTVWTGSDRLQRVLFTNAITSGLGGLVAAVVPGKVDEVLDTGQSAWVRAVGLGLVAFAGVVIWIARAGTCAQRWARWVSEADAAWVVASVMTIAVGWYSASGAVAVAAVAADVAVFGILQWRWSGSAS